MNINTNIPVYVPETGRVYETAIHEFSLAMKLGESKNVNLIRSGNPVSGSVFIAQMHETNTLRKLILNGAINLHNIAPDVDGYEIVINGNILFLLGSNPRGMLHAVYKLQELLAETDELPDDLHLEGTFHIPRRIFHQRFNEWPGTRADIRYISHLGATHCLLTHDWQGNTRHMQGYVTSPLFPDAVAPDEVAKNNRALREQIDNCKDFGLECCLWFTELPCQGGPWVPEDRRQEFLERFPEEILSDCGNYQGKVLCFSHEKVQGFYRDLLKRFFTEFPEISILFIFGLDAGGEFCDPNVCERCKGMSKFEQRDRLIGFLLEEGRKFRPGLRVLTTGWNWDRQADEFLARQEQLPEGSGLYMAAQMDGWQWERQSHELLREARRICRLRNQLFIGYDDFHWGDDTVNFHSTVIPGPRDIQDFPLGIGAKIKRWFNLAVDGVFDHWGTWNEDISCNSIACREFFLNPLADPEKVCQKLAIKQFGRKAGQKAFEAWRALEEAHKILSNALCFSPPYSWPGWYDGRKIYPIPEHLNNYDFSKGVKEATKKANGIIYNEGNFIQLANLVSDSWRTAYPCYEKAVELMEQAVEMADDKPLFYGYFWSEQNSPNRKEHLERQIIYLRSVSLVGREIGIHLGLLSIFCEVEKDQQLYDEKAKSFLSQDIQACLDIAEYFESLKNKLGWADAYRKKAATIKKYVSTIGEI